MLYLQIFLALIIQTIVMALMRPVDEKGNPSYAYRPTAFNNLTHDTFSSANMPTTAAPLGFTSVAFLGEICKTNRGTICSFLATGLLWQITHGKLVTA